MEKFYVYLSDIHGKDIEIEEKILGDIAIVERGEREKDVEKEKSRLIEKCKHADAIGVRHTRITRDIIEHLDRCRIISRFGGGYDNIDVKAATENSIIVAYVPDYCADAVAEHALTFALMKIRNIREFEKRVKNRFWSAQDIHVEMAQDVTLGIIGLGRIGGLLSKKASCVGFNVVAYDPFITDVEFKIKDAKKMEKLDDLLEVSDIIVLCVPLTKENESEYPTYRIIGKREFERMKKGTYIINVCRGEIIDTEALVDALKSEKISGYATDVIEGEPVQDSYLKEGENPYFDRLISLSNVTITPHCGFVSERSIREVKEKGALEIKRVLEGGFPRKVAWVNPEVKEKYLKKFFKKK
jgi:D-3-phosphoglycerate dehydrogenase